MAALTLTTRSRNPQNPTVNTLSASDTLAYSKGKRQEILLYNTTASPVPVTIRGSSATTIVVPGTGGATFDASGGKEVTVPGVIGALSRVELDSLSGFLSGNVTVEDGVGVKAVVLSD